MTHTIETVSLLTPTATPLNTRGAQWAAALFAAVFGAIGRLFAAPVPSAAAVARTRADEAEEVREWALRIRASNPGFADDLLAAAARHETKTD